MTDKDSHSNSIKENTSTVSSSPSPETTQKATSSTPEVPNRAPSTGSFSSHHRASPHGDLGSPANLPSGRRAQQGPDGYQSLPHDGVLRPHPHYPYYPEYHPSTPPQGYYTLPSGDRRYAAPPAGEPPQDGYDPAYAVPYGYYRKYPAPSSGQFAPIPAPPHMYSSLPPPPGWIVPGRQEERPQKPTRRTPSTLPAESRQRTPPEDENSNYGEKGPQIVVQDVANSSTGKSAIEYEQPLLGEELNVNLKVATQDDEEYEHQILANRYYYCLATLTFVFCNVLVGAIACCFARCASKATERRDFKRSRRLGTFSYFASALGLILGLCTLFVTILLWELYKVYGEGV